MKKILLMLAMAGLCGAPLMAQEAEPDPLREKSREELLRELHDLMDKASKDMDKLERELAKSSLDAPKADVIAERVKKAREAMEKGELKDLPPGLREFLARDSAQAAKITGLSEEELKRMAEDAGSLEETLRKNPEILKKLAASEDAFEKILERQLEVEKRLEDALKSTQEATKQAEEKVDQSIEIAHELKSRSSWQGGSWGSKPAGQPTTKDPKEGKNEQGGQNPQQGANSQYNPGGNGPDDKTGDFKRAEGEGFQTDKQAKDMQDAGSSQDRREPGKYKGFWEKFNENVNKKAAERKPNK